MVVKAVVDAFIRQHREFNLGDTDLLKEQYEGFIKAQKGRAGEEEGRADGASRERQR